MSRPERSKPFLKLIGETSGFQAAVNRALPLVADGELVVIGGVAHGEIIRLQLAAIGASARVLLEPVGRDTAAGIAAAAGWVARRSPDAIVAILSADHHVPDDLAFQAAIRATLTSASDGVIVTLGVQPSFASRSYGYIRAIPGPDPLQRVAGFEEKPDAARAETLIGDGALWNSGTFVAAAATFLAEIARHAPLVSEAVRRALDQTVAVNGTELLAPCFADAPTISFDHAVMEVTDRAVVLKASFDWSDLGAWDSVLAASAKDASGNSLSPGVQVVQARDVLVRAPAGMRVAVIGTSRVAVVVEPDAVLVCSLDQSQTVRRIGAGSVPTGRFQSLDAASEELGLWLRTAALPIWGTVGVDTATGRFRDALTWTGLPVDPHRRTRVQARQVFVFSSAAVDGYAGPWGGLAGAGFEAFDRSALRSDGLYASIVSRSGTQTDPTARLYENAFVLLALAGLHRLDPGSDASDRARRLRSNLEPFRYSAGGFCEVGVSGLQANASMHLLEAALMWEAAEPDPEWRALSDELAEHALLHFIDSETGALSEFFDVEWQRLPGDSGLIEPGHQFEWAWLLTRWGRSRQDLRGEVAARRLFEVGRLGFDPVRRVVVNALWPDNTIRDAGARLWPQTEHLKAAVLLGEDEAALEAANALAMFLETPARGVWRERMRVDGSVVDEPAPATSLYHLYLAIDELTRAALNRFPLSRKML